MQKNFRSVLQCLFAMMAPYITSLSLLVLLITGIDGSLWLNNRLYKPQGKNQSGTTEIDLNAIKVYKPLKIYNLTIEHSAISNTNYSALKKFPNLIYFHMIDVTGAPRITKELFQNVPRLSLFSSHAKESYNEVEFEEDAFSEAYKLNFLYIDRLYTISRLSSRFLPPNLNNLRQLTIDNGALSVVEANAFDFTNKIYYLSLRDHGTIKIENGAFKTLTELEYLYLDGNNIENFSWDMFRVLPEVKLLTVSNINPDKLVGRKIRKHLPKLAYLMVYTDNCKQYEHIPRYYNGLILLFLNSNNKKCPKM